MLMPEKHIRFSESIVGLGGYVLNLLTEQKTVDVLWEEFSHKTKTGQIPFQHSLKNFILAIDALYAIGAITETDCEGGLKRCD